ncbi:hypothetical protein HYX18_00535 [Candidatus Woesearchaeota archaeon]|nr:hypothetical protein [Candidatus Woesearchaeota archaeon]
MTNTNSGEKTKHHDYLIFYRFGDFKSFSLASIAKKLPDNHLDEFNRHLNNDFPANTDPYYYGPKGASAGPDLRPIYPLISAGLLVASIYCGMDLVKNNEILKTQEIILGPLAILGGLAMSGVIGLVAYRDLVDYNRARSIVKKRISGLESMVI